MKIKLPSWLTKDLKRSHDYQVKKDWINNWIDVHIENVPRSGKSWSEDFLLIYCGGVILSLILVIYSYIMLGKEEIINSLARMMVVQSLKYGVTFSQVYTSLGAAIIMAAFIPVTLLLFVYRWQPKQNYDKILAEIAYTLEHTSAQPDPRPTPAPGEPSDYKSGEIK